MPAITKIWNLFRVLDVSGKREPAAELTSGPLIAGADNEPERATYGAGVPGFNPAANPTDIITITGAAGRLVRVKSISLSALSSATGNTRINLIRRSAANTGGTFATVIGCPHDIDDGPPSAVVRTYTVNPAALGTQVGILHTGRLLFPQTPTQLTPVSWQWTWINDKAITLRGVNDILAVSMGGDATPTSGAIDIDLLWTEE